MNRSWMFVLAASLLAAPASSQTLDASAELMRTLTEAPGPSAFEESVREIVVREFEDLGADIRFVDLHRRVGGDPPAPPTARPADCAQRQRQRITAGGELQSAAGG